MQRQAGARSGREAFGLYSKGDGRPREDLNRDSDNLTCVLKRLLWL